MQLQVTMPKTAEITYLEANKEQTRQCLTYLELSKLDQRYGWCFWSPNDSLKYKHDIFSGYKQTSKVCLVYLESKLQQDRYGWCICKLKCKKLVERRYLERNKQIFRDKETKNKVPPMFLDVNMLKEMQQCRF